VDNTAAPGGTGTLAAPFDTLVEAETASAAGDTIFVFEGDGTDTGQDAGITLKNDQRLIGQGVGLIVGPAMIVPASGNPVISNGAGSGVTLASDNTVRGLTLGDCTAEGLTGGTFGLLTLSDVTIDNAIGGALDLDDGTADAVLDALTSTNSASEGVRINAVTGTFTVLGPIQIASTAGGFDGLSVVNSGGTFDFQGKTAVSTTGDEGIALSGTNGPVTFGAIEVNGTTGRGLEISGAVSDVTITNATFANVTPPVGFTVRIENQVAGCTILFENLNVFATPSTDCFNLSNNAGTVEVLAGLAIQSGGNDVLDVESQPASGMVRFGANGRHTGSGQAVEIDASAGTVEFSGQLDCFAGSQPVVIGGGAAITGGSIAFTGATLSATQTSVLSISNVNAGANVSFSGEVDLNNMTATGLVLSLNAGAVSFADIDVVTPNGSGIVANNQTGLFTVTTGSVNATNGPALNLNNTSISGTFSNVSSTSSPTTGINLVLCTGTLAMNGGALTGTTGAAFNENTGAATVNYNGAITQNNPAAAVAINGKTGGATTFGGLVTANASTANAISLTNNTGATINFNGGLDIDTTSADGFTATGGGTINVTGAGNSVTTTETSGGANDAGSAVVLNGVSIGASNVTFAALSAIDVAPAKNAVDFTNVSSPGTFNGGATTIAEGADGVSVTGSSAGMTFTSLSVSNTVADGIELTNNTGTKSFSIYSFSGIAGRPIDISQGTAAISIGLSGTSTNATDRTVSIENTTGGSVSITGGTLNIDGGGGVQVNSNSGAANIDVDCDLDIDIVGETAITANNNSGGTDIDFGGATKSVNTGTATAASLSTNAGATIHFSGGGLDIDTTSGGGLNATGGGTVNVTGANNTLTTTTGTALNVASTNIGASGLTFQSISAGTGAGSTGVGINLDNTGVAAGNGGLTVTGNSGAGTGGTIQHKTGADGSTTSGIGIFLNSTKNPSFNWMQLNDFDNSAITGRSVQGFTLTDSVINGVIGTTNVGPEGPINFGVSNPGGTNGLQGTGLIRNCKISGGVEHNLEFYNQSGSMNLTIEGQTPVSEGGDPNSPADDVADCIIEENSLALGADGIQIEMQDTSTATVVIDRCLFRDNKSQAVQVSALNSSVVTVTIDECFARRFDQGNEGFILANGSNADMTAMISNNSVNNYGGTAIFVGQVPGNANAGSILHASILNNLVNQPTTATNHGIIAFLTSTVGQISDARLRIDGNNVTNNSTSGTTRGILVDTPDGSTTPAFHATVSNNTVSVGDNIGGVAGLVVQARQASDGCANIHTNTVTFPNGTPGGIFGLRARQANTATFDLEQSASCMGTPDAVLACRNPGATTEVLGTLTVVPAGSCLLPNTP
jgi:hypothetical protein